MFADLILQCSVSNQAPFVIFGSKFSEDRSEEYRYRVLSKIILCMETGRTVILKDLEDVYGSLYGMKFYVLFSGTYHLFQIC